MFFSIPNEIPSSAADASGTSIQPESAESRLRALSVEHDDLDAAIAALLKDGSCDGLLITRLKKRKLQLKDEIAFAMLAGHCNRIAQAS